MALFPLGDLLSKLRDGITKALNIKGEVEITGSNVQLPTEIQGRATKTQPAHQGILISPSGNNQSDFVEVGSYADIGIYTKANVSLPGRMQIIWSGDGVNNDSWEVVNTGTAMHRPSLVAVKARFARIVYENQSTDTPVTVSSWMFLKP